MKKLELLYSKARRLGYIGKTNGLLIRVEGTVIPAEAILSIAVDREAANEYIRSLFQQYHLPQSIKQDGTIYIPSWRRRNGVAI